MRHEAQTGWDSPRVSLQRTPSEGAKLPKGTGEQRCRLGPRAETQQSLQGSRGCGEGGKSEKSLGFPGSRILEGIPHKITDYSATSLVFQ